MHQTLRASNRKEVLVEKNPHAVALGSLGGKAKVPKGVHLLPPAERSAIARKAAAARWAKKDVEGIDSLKRLKHTEVVTNET
jgi:hypothetical protein